MKRNLSINLTALILTFWISLNLGATKLDDVAQLLLGGGHEIERSILTEIRLPRVIAAIAVGAALGIAGALAQAVTRNNLAEPGILGTTSGAAFFALIAISLNLTEIGSLTLALIATVGGLITTGLLFYFVRRSLDGLALVIIGIAVSATLSGLVGILASIIKDPNAKGVTFWSLGTLSLATQQNALVISVITTILGLFGYLYARNLDYLALGDLRASHLGVSPIRVRGISLFLMATIVGFVTSTFGAITFIALATPHIARSIYGVTHQKLILGSALVGAVLLLIADTASRSLAAPTELPISLLTALIGAPFLAGAVYRGMRRS